jgi:hydroxymethylpyrimidine kinase/phosphomethylpyrimidine kinase/thiamine-phosphate diphosphorylase
MDKNMDERWPIAWTIAGSDSGGGAGIQADLKTFNALEVHGCTILTAITAQNTGNVDRSDILAADLVEAQIRCLAKDLPPDAIKIGMVGIMGNILAIVRYLKNSDAPVVCDPVMGASSGRGLMDPSAVEALRNKLMPQLWMITPNIKEAEILARMTNLGPETIPEAAKRILSYGPASVLIKGGHVEGEWARDYFTDGENELWLSSPRADTGNDHGTGCILSSAIAACLARNPDAGEALVTAKAFVNQALRHSLDLGQGAGPLGIRPFPEDSCDLPLLTTRYDHCSPQFPTMEAAECDLYPVVDSAEWVERLLAEGVQMIQLRMKNRADADRDAEVLAAVSAGRTCDARVFINDDWELALKHGAYGVHLGQDDLAHADLKALAAAGMRLGLSTHSLYEIARARSFNPSYIAIGTVHQTSSKTMDYEPLGIDRFRMLRTLVDIPVVAIGGITAENAPELRASGADYCAVISDIRETPDLSARVQAWRKA